MKKVIHFGVAKDIITPCTITTMMGFGSVYGNTFEGIHDDLYVRTLLIRDSICPIILISLDLCFHDDSLTEKLRSYAFEKYSIPSDNLLVIYTHTHFGPTVKGYHYTFCSQEYEDFLYERIAQCIDRVFLNIYEGYIEYSSVEGDWNISRRHMVDGEMKFEPNLEGGRDKSIYLLKFCTVTGELKALLTSFACHPSNLNAYRMISSEYPGRLCHLLEAQNYGCTVLFFQGCGADAKLKIGAKSSKFHPINHDECNEVANSMALRVQNTLLNGKWMPIVPKFASKMFQIKVPLEVYPISFFEKEAERFSVQKGKRFDTAMVDANSNNSGKNSSLFMWACSQYIVDNYHDMPGFIMLNCSVIRLSEDLYIYITGGEPSYDVKQVLQQVKPEIKMLFFGYSDAISYIPSDKMLEEGGYEAGDGSVTEYRLKGKIKHGIDSLLISSFRNVIEQIENGES